VFSPVSRTRERTRSLRAMTENMLQRGFFSYWIEPALRFVAIQGLVTLPADVEARG
jgi:hypothetical protein